jgi:hypothetical protein
MIIYRSYIFQLSVSEDMKSMLHMNGGDRMEGSGTHISNINYQAIKN